MRHIVVRTEMTVEALKRYITRSLTKVRLTQSNLTLKLRFEAPLPDDVLEHLNGLGYSTEQSQIKGLYILYVYWRTV